MGFNATKTAKDLKKIPPAISIAYLVGYIFSEIIAKHRLLLRLRIGRSYYPNQGRGFFVLFMLNIVCVSNET